LAQESGVDPTVFFRFAYVSGVVETFVVSEHGGQGGVISIFVTNAGVRPETAQTVLIQIHDFPFGVTVLDSGPVALDPMEVLVKQHTVTNPDQSGRFWCRIFTTSESLVPSMLAVDPFVPEKQGDFGSIEPATPERTTYYAPADFAHFALPYHVIPPIGPIGPVDPATL
jgi:hypothetical protein